MSVYRESAFVSHVAFRAGFHHFLKEKLYAIQVLPATSLHQQRRQQAQVSNSFLVLAGTRLEVIWKHNRTESYRKYRSAPNDYKGWRADENLQNVGEK